MGEMRIEFTQDYANFKKGDDTSVGGILGRSLIDQRKVAKLWKPKAKKVDK